MPRLAALYCYPVKSCRGVMLDEAVLDRRGIIHDREFMAVDAEDRFLTQRATPTLGRVSTGMTDDALYLKADGMDALHVPWNDPGRASRRVTVWRDVVTAADAGDGAAAWLSAVIGQTCRLVAISGDSRRDVPAARIPEVHRSALAGPVPVAFSDAFPLLVLSQESLDDLNRRVGGTPHLSAERFRPNLVVAGCDSPHAEDRWQTYRVGGVKMFSAGACTRCPIPTIDPVTLARGPEPLRTLAGYRRAEGGGVVFGQNVIHAQPGALLRIGDEVVLEN